MLFRLLISVIRLFLFLKVHIIDVINGSQGKICLTESNQQISEFMLKYETKTCFSPITFIQLRNL